VTKQEFIQLNTEAIRKYNRRAIIAVGIGWGFIIAMVIYGIPLIKKLRESDLFEHPEFWKRYWFEAAFGVLLLLFAFAVSQVKQIYGVVCPHCRRLMFGMSAKLAAMTGNCAHCGERVLNESKRDKIDQT
jgi:hypothetical protein